MFTISDSVINSRPDIFVEFGITRKNPAAKFMYMSFSCVLSSYSEIHFNLAEKTTPVGFYIISGLPLLKRDIDTSYSATTE